jgi:hypothetical protein
VLPLELENAAAALERLAAVPTIVASGRVCVAVIDGRPELRERPDVIIHPIGSARAWWGRVFSASWPRCAAEFIGPGGLRTLARDAERCYVITLSSFDRSYREAALRVIAAGGDVDLAAAVRDDPTAGGFELQGDSPDHTWLVSTWWGTQCPTDLIACLETF